MKRVTTKKLKSEFKQLYFDEFNDPNESFMDFLLDLIPREKLLDVLEKGEKYYFSLFPKYK